MVRVAVSHSLVTIEDLEWSGLLNGSFRAAQLGPRFRTPER
jgi:hypothetical protein